MYKYKHTAICRSNVINEICFGDASSLTEADSVCVDSLKIVCGKCALPTAIAGFVMPVTYEVQTDAVCRRLACCLTL